MRGGWGVKGEGASGRGGCEVGGRGGGGRGGGWGGVTRPMSCTSMSSTSTRRHICYLVRYIHTLIPSTVACSQCGRICASNFGLAALSSTASLTSLSSATDFHDDDDDDDEDTYLDSSMN